MIRIKEDVRIGDIIIEKGDRIKILESVNQDVIDRLSDMMSMFGGEPGGRNFAIAVMQAVGNQSQPFSNGFISNVNTYM